MKKIQIIIIAGALLGIGILSGYFFSEFRSNKELLIVEKTQAYETQFAFLISEQLTALPTITPFPSSTPTSTNTPIPPSPTPEPTYQGGGSGTLMMTYYEQDVTHQLILNVDENILRETNPQENHMFFSPDGKKTVSITENGIEVSIFDGTKMEFQSDFINSNNGLFSYTWFPDSQKILILFSPGSTVISPNFNWHYRYYNAYILNLIDQNWVFITDNVTFFSYSESNISPDGQWITLLKSDQMTYIASTDGTSIRPVITSNSSDIPFFSPDGKSLLFLKGLQDTNGNISLMQFNISTLESTELLTGNFYSDNPIVSTQTMKIYLRNSIIDMSSIPPIVSVIPKPDLVPSDSWLKVTHLSPDKNWMATSYITHSDELYYTITNLSTLESTIINYIIPEIPSPWSLDSKQIIVFDNDGVPYLYDVINHQIIRNINHPNTDSWLYISWLP